jgi:hypothetical protein
MIINDYSCFDNLTGEDIPIDSMLYYIRHMFLNTLKDNPDFLYEDIYYSIIDYIQKIIDVIEFYKII